MSKRSKILFQIHVGYIGLETMQHHLETETILDLLVNNAEKYNNIADKYKNLDDATNDAMDLNSTKSSNAVSAKDKNSYLDKQKSGYSTIVTRDKNEQNEYNKAITTFDMDSMYETLPDDCGLNMDDIEMLSFMDKVDDEEDKNTTEGE